MDKSIGSHNYKIFLRALRAARRRSGLTQIELAARLGETQSFVSKCERGERRLDIVEVCMFCNAFEISLTTFARRLEDLLPVRKSRTNRRGS